MDPDDIDSLASRVDSGLPLLLDGFTAAHARAVAADPAYEITGRGKPPGHVFFYDHDGCGSYWVHSNTWANASLDDPLQLSMAVAELRKSQWLTHKLFREYVPGFEHAHLVDLHPHIARALHQSWEEGSFTECSIPRRHIEQGDDVSEQSVARIMGHPDSGQAPGGWQLPYRSLIPKGLEGLLVTGKPVCRKIHYHGTTAAVGQAAGAAAAVAAGTAKPMPLRDICVKEVQKELQRQGAVVF
jgi:hypothetical protein